MPEPLTIAVAQPRCAAKNVRLNAVEHAATIRRINARLVVFPELSLTGYELDAAGAEIAYRKSYLGGDEPQWFAPGNGAVVIDLDGWRVGLGICKDTGVDEHVADVAALGVDLYVAGLVHLPEELDVQEERAARIARACDSYVGFASFAGPTGGGYSSTAGVSSIWAADGTALARAGTEPGDAARRSLT